MAYSLHSAIYNKYNEVDQRPCTAVCSHLCRLHKLGQICMFLYISVLSPGKADNFRYMDRCIEDDR